MTATSRTHELIRLYKICRMCNINMTAKRAIHVARIWMAVYKDTSVIESIFEH